MPPIRHEKRQKLIEQEGRMELAIQALKNKKKIYLFVKLRGFSVYRVQRCKDG
jgi:hypothetical protein